MSEPTKEQISESKLLIAELARQLSLVDHLRTRGAHAGKNPRAEGATVSTTFLIAAQFGPVIPLAEIAGSMLGLDDAQAKRKAAHDELPIPVFRNGQKGPWLVRATDLAAWFDKCAEEARERMVA
jgi:hypothetical protein